ncbi:MAG: NUDIX hydrolase [Cyanobacteria bacterium J06627_28]
MSPPHVEVALAILHREGRLLMQLRDDLPSIVYPGIWGLFGGHIEAGETPRQALLRELVEEIGYVPNQLTRFCQQEDVGVRRHYFYGELAVPMSELTLGEGQDMGLCSPAELKKGELYSPRLGEVRSLGRPHRQTLLNFVTSHHFQAHSFQDSIAQQGAGEAECK